MPKANRNLIPITEQRNSVIRLSDLGIFDRTPEQVDLQIQIERVLRILDDTIEKLKISVCLPAFLKFNACWLQKHFDANEVEYIKAACAKYTDLNFTDIKNIKALNKMSVIIDKISMNQNKNFKDVDTMVDPHMAHVLELLWNNNAIREKALQDYEKMTDKNAKTLISCIKNLRDIAQKRLPQTASEQRLREKHLRKSWQENQTMQEEIAALKNDLENQRKFYEAEIKEKNRVILDTQKRMKTFVKEFKQHVKEKTANSEKLMARSAVRNNHALEILTADAKSITHQYEALLTQHLEAEKKLRAKRFKVETQLISWLNKFDEDMGERQKLYDEYKEAYELDNMEIEKLQKLYDEQEKEYNEIMREKNAEEQRQLQMKVEEMARNRAARIIQRFWREYYLRKLERIRQRKGKGKGKRKHR